MHFLSSLRNSSMLLPISSLKQQERYFIKIDSFRVNSAALQPRCFPSFHSTTLNASPGCCLASWLQDGCCSPRHHMQTHNIQQRGRAFSSTYLFFKNKPLLCRSPIRSQRPNQSLVKELRPAWFSRFRRKLVCLTQEPPDPRAKSDFY